MGRTSIEKNVERRLYAESMGRCMNPACQAELFRKKGDIIERAHIVPYCETADNVFENLVVLCPSCHTDFDKNHAFASDEIINWKKIRREQFEKIFCQKYDTFNELKNEIAPLLCDNKSIYENYYLNDEKELWKKFEGRILANNRKLKLLLENNMNLIQRHDIKDYSNLELIRTFIAHVDEFEATRCDEEKHRKVLFPTKINSMFGVEPVKDTLLPMTESLEILVEKLNEQGELLNVVIGINRPYIQIKENNGEGLIYLDDTPRLRQMFFDYDCFRSPSVRFDSLNFALKYIRSKKIGFKFLNYNNFREIIINETKMVFVYDYCLSVATLKQWLPEENTVIVNLHNWNGTSCISHQAYDFASKINVTLLTMEDFYEYINEIKNK